MALTNFVAKVTKITAVWLNKVDKLLVTVFDEAATKPTARTALGATSTGDALFTAANPNAARAALYITDTQVTKRVNTIAELKALNTSLFSTNDSIIVLGYGSIGDGGGGPPRYLVKGAAPGTYTEDGGSIIRPNDVTDGSAAWLWGKVVPVNGRWWGIKADGITDETTLLNAVTAYAITNDVELILPSGAIKITSPWLIFSFINNSFEYFNLSVGSETMSYAQNPTGTQIVVTYKNVPACILQKCRGVHMSDIRFIGLNDYEGTLGADYDNLLNETLFIGGGGGGHRDSRYSPYTGIAVDPFRSGLPADGGYPGLSSYYVASAAAGSSYIVFDRVTIRGFIVGVGLQLGGGGSNTDNITFNDCQLTINKVGWAIGHGQCKAIHYNNGSIYGALYGIDGVFYGDQIGATPVIHGTNFGGAKFLFNLKGDAHGGNFTGLHAEAFLSIGYFGGSLSGAAKALNIGGSTFDFYECTSAKQVDTHLQVFMAVVFNGCGLYSSVDTSKPVRLYKDSRASLSFISCSIHATYIDTPQFAICGSWGIPAHMPNTTFDNTYVHDILGSSGSNIFSNNYVALASLGGSLSGAIVPPGTKIQNANDPTKIFFTPALRENVPIGSIALTVSGNIATFIAPDVGILRVGDSVWSDTGYSIRSWNGAINYTSFGPVGIITNINGTTITLSGITENFISATHTLYVSNWSRVCSPTIGDTNSNNQITNVSFTSAWKVGIRIWGTGIPIGTYITAINGTTFTISKNATATATGVRLYNADIYSLTGAAV